MNTIQNNVMAMPTPKNIGGAFCARLMGVARFLGAPAVGMAQDAFHSRIERCFEVQQP